MDPPGLRSDASVLADLGERLTSARLARNLTQSELAQTAGVSKRTVERLEAGRSGQLTSFVRVLRALDLLGGLEAALPAAEPGPMDLLRRDGRAPKRASRSEEERFGPWTWADED